MQNVSSQEGKPDDSEAYGKTGGPAEKKRQSFDRKLQVNRASRSRGKPDRRVISRKSLNLALRGRTKLNDAVKEEMLTLLQAIVGRPLTADQVGREYSQLWSLESDIPHSEMDRIIGQLLGLGPGEAVDLAVACEDWLMDQRLYEPRVLSVDSVRSPANAGIIISGESIRMETDNSQQLDVPKVNSVTQLSMSESLNGVPTEGTGLLDETDESEATHGTPNFGKPSDHASPSEVIQSGASKPRKKRGKPGVELLPNGPNKLSDKERATLEDCIKVIKEGMDAFVQVGSAIATIILQKLYRETHQTFQHYANEVLGITPRRAYQLKDASEVIDNLKHANNCSHVNGRPTEFSLPTNENQVRALKKFSAELQREIWQEAVKSAGGKKVTGELLGKVIKAREKQADEFAKKESREKETEQDSSTLNTEIEHVIAALNRAWKASPEEQRATLLDRISQWLTAAGDANQTVT
jgi:hypothetical protein